MADLADVREGFKAAYEKIQNNPYTSAFVSAVLQPIPVVGTFLQKAYENSSSQEKSKKILHLLEILQDNDEKLQALIETVKTKPQNQLEDTEILEKLFASNGDITKALQRIEESQAQQLVKTQQILDAVKAPEKYISFLCLNLTGITNREDILAEIAHVNINMDGRSIPFVSSDQIQIALDRASQGRGLFITGPRGSGKSRLLFEASKKNR